MLDEKICRLREKLNDSIISGQDYSVTYELSIQLDKLIAEYYQIELNRIDNTNVRKLKKTRRKVLKP